MKKFYVMLAAAAALTSAYGTESKRMQLEWGANYPADTAYEVELNRAKLEKLGAIDKHSAYKVTASVNGKEQKLDVKAYPGKQPDSIALRFTVPAGTSALFCEPADGKITLLDAKKSENIFAGALDRENLGKWLFQQDISATAIPGGIRFDNKKIGSYKAAYTVDVPAGSAGRPVKLELDVKSVSKMAWPNTIKLQQLGADGKELPEYVNDFRWISQMRPTGILTEYREDGVIRPDAKKIRIEFTLSSSGSSFNNHGLPLKNQDDVIPHLEVSRLVLRSAEKLPFPKYNDLFFDKGVTGTAGDTALVLKNNSNLFMPTRSMAMWGGQAREIRNESEFYFPTGDGTVEAFVLPRWNENASKYTILFNARSRLVKKGRFSSSEGRRDLFSFSYNPKRKIAQILVQDADGTKHQLEGKVTIPKGQWSHVAIQWSEAGGIQFYLNGKKMLDKKCLVKALDISKEQYPNDCHASQFTIGNDAPSARSKTIVPWRTPNYVGLIDVLRVSNIARYNGDFTPQKQVSPDKNTNALFNFDRSFDGTTLFGTGRIPGTLRALESRISPKLEIGNKTVQYIPAQIMPDSDPRVVLNALNYPRTPSAAEYRNARVTERTALQMTPGKIHNLKLDQDVVMDFVEISNPTDKPLVHPFLMKQGEIDPRSFGDLADSLGIGGLTPKGKVNKIFQFLLSASDYFMNHQAMFRPGSDEPENVEYKALMMLNGYCGFECGPLNNLSANLFTTAGLCPASQTSGYGHSFEQVFYDRKSHVYDLSAQKFFSSFDNESAASLEEAELEPGVFLRMRGPNEYFVGSGDHFVRLGNRSHAVQMPSYQAKVGMTLNPGEKFRVYFSNDGMVNNLQCAHHLKLENAAPFAINYEKETGAKVKSPSRKIFRIDRFFPHYANAFLVFNGKPSLNNPAFKAGRGESFIYQVNSCYPIVYGEYSAKLVDGTNAKLEISTDRGRTFRPLAAGKDGVARPDYIVRARQAYLIRINAPISKVAKFTAATEMQVNPRILTARLAKGDNELLFKATEGSRADLLLQYRKAGKEITIDGGFYNGVIPGFERQTALLDPAKPLELKVNGASKNAKVKASCGVEAKLDGGKLLITAKEGRLPRFDAVEINDNGAKKQLTLLVAANTKIAGAAQAVPGKNAKLVKADSNLIQDVVELTGTEADVSVKIGKIPSGKYMVWTLGRFDSHQRPASGPRQLKLGHKGGWISAAGAINCGSEFYKAQYNKPGERAQFKWDYPLQYRYPYLRPVSVELAETDTLKFRTQGIDIGVAEFAAVIVMPEPDTDFLNQMIKVLCGYNHEPWKISADNKDLF